jgi:hypothetical protein
MTAAAQPRYPDTEAVVAQKDVDRLAQSASSLGHDIVDVAGFLDQLDDP